MNLKQLSYIVTIADTQNISHAADQLFISRPALNHYLTTLEKELGYPVFKRIQKEPSISGQPEKFLKSKNRPIRPLTKLPEEKADVLTLELPA